VIARWEGVIFLGYYVAYTVYLILTATEHPNLTQYETFLLLFIAPLTVLTIGVSVAQELRKRRAA
jgi:cation:H+ antiporter